MLLLYAAAREIGLQKAYNIIEKYELAFVAYNQGSIVHLETSGVMLRFPQSNPPNASSSRANICWKRWARRICHRLVTLGRLACILRWQIQTK